MKSSKKNRLNDIKEICDKIKVIFMFNSKSNPINLNDLTKKLILNSDSIRSNYNEGKIKYNY